MIIASSENKPIVYNASEPYFFPKASPLFYIVLEPFCNSCKGTANALWQVTGADDLKLGHVSLNIEQIGSKFGFIPLGILLS